MPADTPLADKRSAAGMSAKCQKRTFADAPLIGLVCFFLTLEQLPIFSIQSLKRAVTRLWEGSMGKKKKLLKIEAKAEKKAAKKAAKKTKKSNIKVDRSDIPIPSSFSS
jgi:hypothetical protein